MKKVVMFGAGNCGRLIASNLLLKGEEVLCFIDNDPLKAGKSVMLDSTNCAGGGGRNTYLSSFKAL